MELSNLNNSLDMSDSISAELSTKKTSLLIATTPALYQNSIAKSPNYASLSSVHAKKEQSSYTRANK